MSMIQPHDIPALLAERQKWRKDNPLFLVRLNKAQRRFLDCATVDGKLPRRLIFTAANKVGKTVCGSIRGVCLALGEHPFLPEGHPFHDLKRLNWRLPSVGLVVGETLTQTINQKLAPEYIKWIPKICEPTFKRNNGGVVTEITVHKDLKGQPLGSKIFFRSYESNVDSFEGIDYDWVHYDEPPPNDIFVAIERGLIATGGISYLTFTSLKEPWLSDLAAESVDYGGNDPNVRVIEGGDIWNALKENGGHLDREAIEAFIKICPPDEYDARILGKWMESGARIYGTFRDSFPFIIPPFEIPLTWDWYEILDPADGKHSKWLFAAAAPDEVTVLKQRVSRLFVVDWLSFPAGTLITDMVREVKRKRLELDYTEPIELILDAKFGSRRTTTVDRGEAATWADKLADAGVGYVKLSRSAPGDVDVGHNVVREYLRPQLWSMAMNEEMQEIPGIVFFTTCRGKGGPIESMMKYKRQLKSDKPEEMYKDWPDCVRYLCMEYPRCQNRHHRVKPQKTRNRFTGV